MNPRPAPFACGALSQTVDQHRNAVAAFDVFKEQRGTAGASILFGRAFGNPIGDLSDLQDGIDFSLDLLELTGAIQRGNPVSEVGIRQSALLARQSWGERTII